MILFKPAGFSFGPPFLALVDYHLERGWMPPLHDVVEANGEKGATTENQGAGAWYMGEGVCVG